VASLAISPDGKWLASGENMKIGLWSLPDGGLQSTLAGFDEGVNVTAMAFSPDGRLLASGGDDGRVFLWEMTGLKRRCALSDPGLQKE
jgi:WD40 repeat protein